MKTTTTTRDANGNLVPNFSATWTPPARPTGLAGGMEIAPSPEERRRPRGAVTHG